MSRSKHRSPRRRPRRQRNSPTQAGGPRPRPPRRTKTAGEWNRRRRRSSAEGGLRPAKVGPRPRRRRRPSRQTEADGAQAPAKATKAPSVPQQRRSRRPTRPQPRRNSECELGELGSESLVGAAAGAILAAGPEAARPARQGRRRRGGVVGRGGGRVSAAERVRRGRASPATRAARARPAARRPRARWHGSRTTRTWHNGRGAYVCRDETCIAPGAFARGGLSHALLSNCSGCSSSPTQTPPHREQGDLRSRAGASGTRGSARAGASPSGATARSTSRPLQDLARARRAAGDDHGQGARRATRGSTRPTRPRGAKSCNSATHSTSSSTGTPRRWLERAWVAEPQARRGAGRRGWPGGACPQLSPRTTCGSSSIALSILVYGSWAMSTHGKMEMTVRRPHHLAHRRQRDPTAATVAWCSSTRRATRCSRPCRA